MSKLFLKIYYESSNIEIVNDFSFYVKNELDNVCHISVFKIDRYWKIEGLFEVSFDIEIEGDINLILEFLASGWEKKGQNYIWNVKENNSFISLMVRWAQLEIIE